MASSPVLRGARASSCYRCAFGLEVATSRLLEEVGGQANGVLGLSPCKTGVQWHSKANSSSTPS